MSSKTSGGDPAVGGSIRIRADSPGIDGSCVSNGTSVIGFRFEDSE